MARSRCAYGIAAVTVKAVADMPVADKEAVVAAQVDWLLRTPRNLRQGVERSVEAIDMETEELFKRIREVESEVDEPWFAKTGLAIVGPSGKPLHKNVYNQFAQAKANARATGQIRELASIKGIDVNEQLPTELIKELGLRMRLKDTWIRSQGVPLVTLKAAAKGSIHASHLSFGDILNVFISNGFADNIGAAVFRNSDPIKNIPFQNVQEAAREVIEHLEDARPFDGEDLIALKEKVGKALTEASGNATDPAAKKAQAQNKEWLSSGGKASVDEITELLTTPVVRDALMEENKKQLIMHLAFSRGDGFSMTDQVLKTIMDSPWAGDKIDGLGGLLFDNGLKKMFSTDFNVQLSLDGSTLVFAEQFLAKVANNLAPESLATIKAEFEAAKAARKAQREGWNSGASVNKNRKAQSDDMAELAAKKAEKDVMQDSNAKVGESSTEGAIASETFYNELKYGSVAGGLAKLIASVSDTAMMSGKGKTLLLGIEHRRLENAAIVSQGMVKLREVFGGSAEEANAAFELIKRAGSSREAIEEAIKGLDPAKQQGVIDMADYLQKLFGFGDHNSLMANGIFVDELKNNLRAVGLMKVADELPDVINPADIPDYWKQLSYTDQEDILTVMNKFYTAQQLSMIAPSMSDSLVRHFGHAAEGLTYKQALNEGWRPLDTSSALGKYMQFGDEPVLFPPEVLPKVKEMEKYITYDKTFANKTFNNLIKKIDGTTSILKSSLTLWRPGHHMVSFLGNTFFNTLAGVMPWDYGAAVKLMVRRGNLTDVDNKSLNELIQANTPVGTTLKDPDIATVPVRQVVNGKGTFVDVSMDDILRGADTIAGVPISPRRVRDTVTADYLNANEPVRSWKDRAVPRHIANVDHQIAQVAAHRDNLARYALFVRELRRSNAATLEEAFLEAGRKVHEFHPTVGTLTAAERKYARRVFYFYTWQKQALFKILEMTANKPALISVPSKMQYALATAQGLDPNSFGDPYSATGLWAAYNENSVYGPQWNDDVWGAMGVKPALPQLDVIDTYLSPIAWKPEDGLWGNLGNMADESVRSFLTNNAAPVIRMPAEYLTRTTAGDVNREITQPGEYLLDQTSVGTLSRVFDWTPWGNRSDTKLDPYADANRQRQFWNWLLGFKITSYQSPPALQNARQNQIDYWQKTLKTGKFAPKPSIYDLED